MPVRGCELFHVTGPDRRDPASLWRSLDTRDRKSCPNQGKGQGAGRRRQHFRSEAGRNSGVRKCNSALLHPLLNRILEFNSWCIEQEQSRLFGHFSRIQCGVTVSHGYYVRHHDAQN